MHISRKMAALLAAVMMVWTAPALTGCTPKVGGNDYATAGAQGAYTVKYGNVVSVRNVVINNDNSGNTALGTVGGGVIGGVIGNMFGGGKGNTLATLGGAVAGAALGAAGSQAMGNQAGVEVTVRLDNGGTMAVVQGADMVFTVGQRVRIMQGEGTTRVVPE